MKYFFSYSRNDSEFVIRLANDLKQQGLDVWLDQLDILPGSRWDAAVETALNESQGMLVVLSDSSVKSNNVLDEVSYAINKGKKVIPLLFDECEVPFRIARFQHVDFTKNYNTGLQVLIRALKSGNVATPSNTPAAKDPQDQPGDTEGEPTALLEKPFPGKRKLDKRLIYFPVAILLLIVGWFVVKPGGKNKDERSRLVAAADSFLSKTGDTPSAGIKSNYSTDTDNSKAQLKVPIDKTAGSLIQSKDQSIGQPVSNKVSNESSSELNNVGPVGKKTFRRAYPKEQFHLSIEKGGSFKFQEFTLDKLRLDDNFSIKFRVASYRKEGSTRYGIAWNFKDRADFLLFTIHTANTGYYSIGPGNSQRYTPWSRFTEGAIDLNGETGPDELTIKKMGAELIFLINDKEVWSTTQHKIDTDNFAFWVADRSEAALLTSAVTQ